MQDAFIIEFNTMRLLFNDNPADDLRIVLGIIDGFAKKSSSLSLAINFSKLDSLIRYLSTDFPHKDGVQNASVFKKVSMFVANFCAERPVQGRLDKIDELGIFNDIPQYENALIALLIALNALQGAEIKKNGSMVILDKSITMSKHSLVDVVDALIGATPATSFKLLTIFFEQLCYKTNPEAQYESFPVSQLITK